MAKRTTLKDIARESGYSVAAVSFVINGNAKGRISAPTAAKIRAAARELNYMPNEAARTLVTGRTNVIGLAYELSRNCPGRNAMISEFVRLLQKRLHRLNLNATLIPIPEDGEYGAPQANVDAIIAIDLALDRFSRISFHSPIPVIAVDSLIPDEDCYRIYTDYPTIISYAAAYEGRGAYICLDALENVEYFSYITKGFADDHILLFPMIDPDVIASIGDAPVICLGATIASIILPYYKGNDMCVVLETLENKWLPSNVTKIPFDTEKKANLTVNIVLNAIKNEFEIDHNIPVV